MSFFRSRFKLFNEGLWRYKSDGLNSMMYSRLALEFRELYTWIYVQANEAVIMKVCTFKTFLRNPILNLACQMFQQNNLTFNTFY